PEAWRGAGIFRATERADLFRGQPQRQRPGEGGLPDPADRGKGRYQSRAGGSGGAGSTPGPDVSNHAGEISEGFAKAQWSGGNLRPNRQRQSHGVSPEQRED